jgi:hypothetical protein
MEFGDFVFFMDVWVGTNNYTIGNIMLDGYEFEVAIWRSPFTNSVAIDKCTPK